MLYVQNIIFKMDSFEINKIIAAILMVALLLIGLSKLTNVVFHVKKPEIQGYKVMNDEKPLINTSIETNTSEKIDIAKIKNHDLISKGTGIDKSTVSLHLSSKRRINIEQAYKYADFLKVPVIKVIDEISISSNLLKNDSEIFIEDGSISVNGKP